MSLLIGLLLQTSWPDLSLEPRVGYEYLTVTAKVRVNPDYQNVMLCVVWESEDYSGKTCHQADQYSTRLHRFTIYRLPAGFYSLYAELHRVRGIRVSPTYSLRVLDTPFR